MGIESFEEIKNRWNNKTIKTKSEFETLCKDMKANKEHFIFRGQSDSGWNLESSLFRFYKKTLNMTINIDHFLIISRNIFLNTMNKIGKDNDILNMMAEAQHSGTKTQLIDFTSSFESAVWFSLKDTSKNDISSIFLIAKKEEKVKTKIKYWQLYSELRKEDKDTIIYKCPISINNKRGIAQKSFFILHNQNSHKEMMDKYNIIKINIYNSDELKEYILKFLFESGIKNESIFPDSKGIVDSFVSNTFPSDKYILKGDFYARNNKCEEAYSEYQKAIKLNPKKSKGYTHLGDLYYNRLIKENDYDLCIYYKNKAIENYNKSIELNPNNEHIFNILGIFFNSDNSKENKKGIECFKKSTQINPNYSIAYANWGQYLIKSGLYEQAIEKLKKAIHLNPDHNYYYSLANALYSLSKEQNNNKLLFEANYNYEKSIELNHDNSWVYNDWGITLMSLRKFTDAIEKFQKAIELNINNEKSHRSLSICFKKRYYKHNIRTDYKKSIYHCRKVILFNPNHYNSYDILMSLIPNNTYWSSLENNKEIKKENFELWKEIKKEISMTKPSVEQAINIKEELLKTINESIATCIGL